MRTDGTTNLRRAKNMKIGFLSGVTAPAHEGANSKIMKVKSTTEGERLLKSVFTAALAERQLQEKVSDIISNSWPLNDALREAAEDIAKDDTITDKNAALSQAVNEYILAMQVAATGKLMKAKKTEAGVEFPASDYAYVPDAESPSTWKLRLTSTPGGEPDTRIVGAAVAALGEGFRGNKVEIPESDLPGVITRVKSAWLKANPEKSNDDLPDVLKKSENTDMSELEKYKALAKMSDVHKTYHDNLPESEQEGFRNMEPTARDAVIAMTHDEQFVTLTGETVIKSKAGSLYIVLKSQDEELRKARVEVNKQKARERVIKDFADLPGTEEEKIQQVLALESLDPTVREGVEKQLTQANDLWKQRRNPATGINQITGDAKTQMAKLIDDWMVAHPGKKRTDAMKAVSATAEGKKLNDQMRGAE